MKQRVPIVTVFLMAVLFLFSACSSERQFVRTELHFSLCKNETCARDADFIADSEWQYFVDFVIAPKFPDGITIVDAQREWINAQSRKMILERSKILVLLHKDGKSETEAIEYIRTSYKQLYRKNSVMKVDSKVEADF
ncbi:MAG: DUF3574 domain-containing protein [Nitrospirae bacterium]|nr:DUF3574 domain-containing protein [Nitrospirota bacterium]